LASRPAQPPPVVFIHGGFCGGWSFDHLRKPFEAAGHATLAPDLRGHEAGAAPQAVVGVSMGDYAADIVKLCESLPAPPILVGHSMGGLVAQMAAMRTPVAAMALLAPSPAWGGSASSVEEAIAAFGLHFLGPYWARSLPPDRSAMDAYCMPRMSKAERDAAFARMVPESGRAIFETLNWWLDPFMTTGVNPMRLKAPALALVGQRDAIHPPRTVRMSARRIGAAFQELPGMSHWLLSEPGWETVADAILAWLAEQPGATA